MVLAHLLAQLGYRFAMAHCNFQLRGRDSDEDAAFCARLAKKLGVTLYQRTFHIPHKSDLQEQARDLRYRWFRELREHHGFHYVLTAHHADDQAETLLLNLIRGTGIKGLRGIAEKQNGIVRPMLVFTRKEIEEYARKKGISYRVDKSNSSDIYKRNFLRLHVMPLLRQLNPSVEVTFAENSMRFAEEYQLMTERLEQISWSLVSKENGRKTISIARLLDFSAPGTILRYLIADSGFNSTQVQQIVAHLLSRGIAGKQFSSPTHRLTIDRKKIVIESKGIALPADLIIASEADLRQQKHLRIEHVKSADQAAGNELLISSRRLSYPLQIRSVRKGDKFSPFGMKGQKLLSDFAREQKLNVFEKERLRVLVNGNGDILWVIGHRSDERYRVRQGERDIMKITYLEQA